MTVQTCLSTQETYPKCCDSASVLKKINETYHCTEDLNQRTQIVTNSTDFIQSDQDGFCVDIENSVTLFNISDGNLTKVQNLQVELFPKCCPLNYFYNRTSHGCVEGNSGTFFEEKFVTVGLPQCKIIVDLNDKFKKFENETLYLFEKNRIIQKGTFCIDKDQNQKYIVRTCLDNFEICESIKCVRKCCPDGQSFVNGSKCYDTYVHGLDLATFSENMDRINGNSKN